MIPLLSLVLSMQIQAIGFEAGTALFLPRTGFGPQAGLVYTHSFSENFRISSGICYWTKRYRSQEGIRERNCTFSDLYFYEDGMVTTRFFNRLMVGTGVGISVHFLKNYVKESMDYGSFIITQYYAEPLSRFGLRVHLLVELKINNAFLALKGGYTTLLMNTNEQNLFYEVGNMRIFDITLGIGVRT